MKEWPNMLPQMKRIHLLEKNDLFRICFRPWSRAKKVWRVSNVKMTIFIFIIELGFPVMAIIVDYDA
jgi:hypothetical protein